MKFLPSQSNEQQADPNHKHCGQYHIDYELAGS